jgi:hypothetical membrane protein
MRARALAGVAGPVVFTAAWVAGSLRQTGHGVLSVQLSGLAAPDARDPWIMITGFLVLGGCLVIFGLELTGAAARLIQAAGVLAIAAGLLRRDHMELIAGPVSWHNQAHNVVSLVLYADMVVAQFLLARGLGGVWRRYLFASGAATAIALALFLPNTANASAGLLQRIAVTIPLLAVLSVAVRLMDDRGRTHPAGSGIQRRCAASPSARTPAQISRRSRPRPARSSGSEPGSLPPEA